MSVAAADPKSLDAILQNPDDMIDRHLRLATVKCQTTELLVKLRMVNEALQRPRAAAPPALAAPLDLPLPTPQTSLMPPLHIESEGPTEPEIGNL